MFSTVKMLDQNATQMFTDTRLGGKGFTATLEPKIAKNVFGRSAFPHPLPTKTRIINNLNSMVGWGHRRITIFLGLDHHGNQLVVNLDVTTIQINSNKKF